MKRPSFILLIVTGLLAIASCTKPANTQSEQPQRLDGQVAQTNPVESTIPMNTGASSNLPPQSDEPGKLMTENSAVELARKTVAGAMHLAPDVKVTVERTNDQLVVTFGGPPPPGTRGADYDARVVINPKTGKVEKWLVGQ